MSDFNALLLKIDEEILKDELQTMKFACKGCGIGARTLEEIERPLKLFVQLEQRNLLGPENKQFLADLLDKAGRLDLKNKLLGIQDCPVTETKPKVKGAPIVSGMVDDNSLQDISEDLGSDWKPLGRKLGISSSVLDNIGTDCQRVKEKAFSTLSRWKKQNGNSATGQALSDALTAIGRKDVAELLAGALEQSSPCPKDMENAGGLETMKDDLVPQLPTQESSK